jgi:ABC-type sugar transport system ATPase subunit
MIEVLGAHKELGEFSLRGVDLKVEDGEYLVVLGPTGAGKTVLLECIAGIHYLDKGSVFLHGRDVTNLPPEQRNIAYVPQDYVLFSHMSLRRNIEFPLRLRKRPQEEINAIVERLARTLRIERLLERRPRTLSGGEQQRGALARALASSPALLLLDEPLSALDEGTRVDLTEWLARITDELGTTVIHVCHNYDEALDLADRIAVMRDGRILQVGPPTDVLRRPQGEFLARFMGTQNLLPGRADEASGTVRVGENTVLRTGAEAPGPSVLVAIRPESIALSAADAPDDGSANRVRATLATVRDRGRHMLLALEGDIALTVSLTPQAFHALAVSVGDEVWAVIPPEAVHMMASDGD